MLQAGGSGEVSIALANAVLLALWAVLPGLLFGYLWQSRAARRTGTTFALRKSEAAELDRALAAYAKICRRIEDIGEQPRGIRGFWRELLAGPILGTTSATTCKRMPSIYGKASGACAAAPCNASKPGSMWGAPNSPSARRWRCTLSASL